MGKAPYQNMNMTSNAQTWTEQGFSFMRKKIMQEKIYDIGTSKEFFEMENIATETQPNKNEQYWDSMVDDVAC
jgi:hypothetical protein